MYTKRAFSVFMILVTIITIASFGMAEEPVPPGGPVDFTYIDSAAASLSFSGNTARAAGKITPYDHRRTSVTVRLQKSSNGTSGWSTIGTWTGSNPSGISTAAGTKSVSTGYYYRVRTTGKVYDSSGNVLETVVKTTSVRYH